MESGALPTKAEYVQGKRVRLAVCHPGKKHYARGQCRECYKKRFRQSNQPRGPVALWGRAEARVSTTCGHCHRPITIWRSRKRDRNYCSRTCSGNSGKMKGVPRPELRGRRRELFASCHPDLENFKKGQCQPCYQAAHFVTPLMNRESRLKKYGLTVEGYERALDQQKGLCAICRRPETRTLHGKALPLVVDHCHSSSEIRGLICHACNVGLGVFRDDPSTLEEAARYLRLFHQRFRGDYGL